MVMGGWSMGLTLPGVETSPPPPSPASLRLDLGQTNTPIPRVEAVKPKDPEDEESCIAAAGILVGYAEHVDRLVPEDLSQKADAKRKDVLVGAELTPTVVQLFLLDHLVTEGVDYLWDRKNKRWKSDHFTPNEILEFLLSDVEEHNSAILNAMAFDYKVRGEEEMSKIFTFTSDPEKGRKAITGKFVSASTPPQILASPLPV